MEEEIGSAALTVAATIGDLTSEVEKLRNEINTTKVEIINEATAALDHAAIVVIVGLTILCSLLLGIFALLTARLVLECRRRK